MQKYCIGTVGNLEFQQGHWYIFPLHEQKLGTAKYNIWFMFSLHIEIRKDDGRLGRNISFLIRYNYEFTTKLNSVYVWQVGNTLLTNLRNRFPGDCAIKWQSFFASRLHVHLIKILSTHRVKTCLALIIICVNARVVLKITSNDVIIS